MSRKLQHTFWGGRKPKIPLYTADRSVGGANLIDIKNKDMAIKTAWVQKLADDDKLSQLAYKQIQPELKSWIFECNLAPGDVKYLRIESKFWEDVLFAWCSYHYQMQNEVDLANDIFLWYNSNLRIANHFLGKNVTIKVYVELVS